MLIQQEIEHIYDVFTTKVAAGRNLPKASVDSIGQGRVWSGVAAKKIGLVDEFGGMEKAVELAASISKTKDYRIVSYPDQKEWFEELMDQFTGNEPTAKLKEALGPDYQLYQYYKEIREMKGVQARMLMQFSIN